MGGNSQRSISVKATTLDATFRRLRLGKVDIMKIDVEGAEAEALSGCEEHMSRIAHLVIEYDPAAWAARPDFRNKVLDGFEIFKVINSPFLIKRISKEQLSLIRYAANLYLRRPGPGNSEGSTHST